MPNDASTLDSAFSGAPAAAISERYGAETVPPPAWNDVLATLLDHRSVRAYLPDALAPGTAELLVAAAQSAASSSNLQVWSVLAVEDPARKTRLSVFANNQAHIVEAPLFLVWLADLSRAERLAQARGVAVDALPFTETALVAIIDAALAAQNAVVAAESLGLGTVYIGALRNKPAEVAAELGLPPHVMAVFGMCVGHPDPERPTGVKPRLPQSVVLHHEQYSAAQEAEGVAAYDAALKQFQIGQNMEPIGWVRTLLSRLRSGNSLSGRDKLRDIMNSLGFPLK